MALVLVGENKHEEDDHSDNLDLVLAADCDKDEDVAEKTKYKSCRIYHKRQSHLMMMMVI